MNCYSVSTQHAVGSWFETPPYLKAPLRNRKKTYKVQEHTKRCKNTDAAVTLNPRETSYIPSTKRAKTVVTELSMTFTAHENKRTKAARLIYKSFVVCTVVLDILYNFFSLPQAGRSGPEHPCEPFFYGLCLFSIQKNKNTISYIFTGEHRRSTRGRAGT